MMYSSGHGSSVYVSVEPLTTSLILINGMRPAGSGENLFESKGNPLFMLVKASILTHCQLFGIGNNAGKDICFAILHLRACQALQFVDNTLKQINGFFQLGNSFFSAFNGIRKILIVYDAGIPD